MSRKPRPAPKPGPQTKFRPEFVDIARRLAHRGEIDSEIAEVLGCTVKTLRAWRLKYPGLDKAMEIGEEAANHRVKLSLYKSAVGHIGPDGRYYPPVPTSIIWWQKNRESDQWKERREDELPPPPPSPDIEGEHPLVLNRDTARRIAWLLRDRTGETQH
jgi:hypothetical protein